jgi:hypothetical protein
MMPDESFCERHGYRYIEKCPACVLEMPASRYKVATNSRYGKYSPNMVSAML